MSVGNLVNMLIYILHVSVYMIVSCIYPYVHCIYCVCMYFMTMFSAVRVPLVLNCAREMRFISTVTSL